MGRKHQPFYRLVVVPRQNKPGRGRYVEKIGWIDPLQHKREIDKERVQYWLSVGAQPSDTVWNLFVTEGIVTGSKRRKGTSKQSTSDQDSQSDSGTGQAADTKEPKTAEGSAEGEESPEATGKNETLEVQVESTEGDAVPAGGAPAEVSAKDESSKTSGDDTAADEETKKEEKKND